MTLLLWTLWGCTRPAYEVGAVDIAVDVDSDAATPDLLPSEARLFVPGGLDTTRATVVFSSHARGSTVFESDGWREFAQREGLALVEVSIYERASEAPGPVARIPDQAAHRVEVVLDLLSAESGFPEVATNRIVLWGHSGGGFMMTAVASQLPERTAGYIGWHGAVQEWYAEPGPLNDALLSEAGRSIPALFVVAQRDSEPILDSTRLWMDIGRTLDARWAVAIQPDVDHWGLARSQEITLPWVRAILDSDHDESTDSRRGELYHELVYDPDEDRIVESVLDAALVPPGGEPSPDATTVSWLPDPAFAEIWLAYATD